MRRVRREIDIERKRVKHERVEHKEMRDRILQKLPDMLRFFIRLIKWTFFRFRKLFELEHEVYQSFEFTK